MNATIDTKIDTKVNGLDTQQMQQTVAAIAADPVLARFQFRAKNQWVDGPLNRSTIGGFYGAGREDTSRTEPFVLTNDEPPLLLGANRSANPAEFLLHALAGCVTTTLVLHATARGIRIESINTRLEGDIDLRGVLALDDAVSPAYERIRVHMDIKADCSEKELDELLAFTREHSSLVQTISRPVPVVLERGRTEK